MAKEPRSARALEKGRKVVRFTGIPSGAPWLLGAVLGLLLMAPGSALAQRCLSVGTDAADIAATQGVVEGACGCDSFSNHRQYVQCTKAIISSQIPANLRHNFRRAHFLTGINLFRRGPASQALDEPAHAFVIALQVSDLSAVDNIVKYQHAHDCAYGGRFRQGREGNFPL